MLRYAAYIGFFLLFIFFYTHLKSFGFHVIFSHILFITLKHTHPNTCLLIDTTQLCDISGSWLYTPLYLHHGRTVAWAERPQCPGCRSCHKSSLLAATGGCSLEFGMGTPNAPGSTRRYSSMHTSRKTATPHRSDLPKKIK